MNEPIKNKKQRVERHYRLLVRVLDKTMPPFKGKDGKIYQPTQWAEVAKANLGSFNEPNKNILEFRIEPIELEKGSKGSRSPFEGGFFFKPYGGEDDGRLP
jgi:hypothetical protein